jgi:hypothetical protein
LASNNSTAFYVEVTRAYPLPPARTLRDITVQYPQWMGPPTSDAVTAEIVVPV